MSEAYKHEFNRKEDHDSVRSHMHSTEKKERKKKRKEKISTSISLEHKYTHVIMYVCAADWTRLGLQ